MLAGCYPKGLFAPGIIYALFIVIVYQYTVRASFYRKSMPVTKLELISSALFAPQATRANIQYGE